MAKEIWLGPILSDNREQLIHRCSSMLRTAGRPGDGDVPEFLYLAASRPLLDLVTHSLLDASSGAVWGSLPVHLFNGLVNRVLSTAIYSDTGEPVPQRIPIDREEMPVKRSLIARLMNALARQGRMPTLAPLVGMDGCVNSIAKIIGEIQRAAREPGDFEAIVASRSPGLFDEARPASGAIAQSDFDREVALIYRAYRDALDRADLTEEDTSQLLALSVLRGSLDGRDVSLPWLNQVSLLVLDGFFDFTPIQGEMLKVLVPRIDSVIVSLDRDANNPGVFTVFDHTLEQVTAMGDFEIKSSETSRTVEASLATLRSRLFNPIRPASPESSAQKPESPDGGSPEYGRADSRHNIRLFECDDRETEIAAIAKEVRRLVLDEDFAFSDIVVVVRELKNYADVIIRTFSEHSVPLALERRVEITQLPAVRATLKLFDILDEHSRTPRDGVKVAALADLIKTGYFRLSPSDVDELRTEFKRQLARLKPDGPSRIRELPYHIRTIPYWNPDRVENAAAYVGQDLGIKAWLDRARRIAVASAGSFSDAAKRDSLEKTSAEDGESSGEASELTPAEAPARRPGSRPAVEIDPAELIWACLVFERLEGIIHRSLRVANANNLRASVISLLERLGLATETSRPINRPDSDKVLPRTALDLRGLTLLRCALDSASKAFEMADGATANVHLADFLKETIRSLRSVVLPVAGADPAGVRALEVSDVRGLAFRAVFIAGLVEGGFPLRASGDWVYPQEQRETLKSFGLTLEDLSPDTLLKEEHYFYQAACRATDRLYLTRPVAGGDGNATVASSYIDETRTAVSPVGIDAEAINRDFNGDRPSSVSTGSEAAISVVRLGKRAANPRKPPAVESLLPWAVKRGYIDPATLEAIAIERQREGAGFSSFDGLVTRADQLRWLETTFGPESTFSASGFNLYGNCPFKFFVRRVLKIEPCGEAAIDLRAIDAGSLLHDVLKRFFERHRSERLDRLDIDALRTELDEIADRVFDEREQYLPPLSPQVWKIDREIRKVLLQQVLDYERSLEEGTSPKDVRPSYFELAYGMSVRDADPASSAKCLELPRTGVEGADVSEHQSGSGVPLESARIRGRIDRVDVASDGTVTAYDYKLSRGPGVTDMSEGRDVQIALYIEALERLLMPDRRIAGGGYYALRGGKDRRNNGMYRRRMSAYTAIRSAAASSLDDDDWASLRAAIVERVWSYIDAMRAGHFQPTPSLEKRTCATCDYSAVCRYDVFRIRRKLSADASKRD